MQTGPYFLTSYDSSSSSSLGPAALQGRRNRFCVACRFCCALQRRGPSFGPVPSAGAQMQEEMAPRLIDVPVPPLCFFKILPSRGPRPARTSTNTDPAFQFSSSSRHVPWGGRTVHSRSEELFRFALHIRIRLFAMVMREGSVSLGSIFHNRPGSCPEKPGTVRRCRRLRHPHSGSCQKKCCTAIRRENTIDRFLRLAGIDATRTFGLSLFFGVAGGKRRRSGIPTSPV